MPNLKKFSKFREFATCATQGYLPYPYQERLAEEGLPDLLTVPPGCGKTFAAVLPWLWRSYKQPDETPRRLVYVFSSWTLAEQTAHIVKEWLCNLDLLWTPSGMYGRNNGTVDESDEDKVILHMLMGGTELDDVGWQLYPERRTILIGTQDMLLSRALMRGYSETRSRWPISYALLHSDTQWVFDEIQLLGPALPTSAQLQGLRDALGTAAPTRTMWMSATLDHSGLATFDHPANSLRVVDLSPEDRTGPLARRLKATRTIHRLTLPSDAKSYPAAVAKELISRHEPGKRTIAVLNTANRAMAVFQAVRQAAPQADVVLVHSRFRPHEWKTIINRALSTPPENGRYVISTQVLETGFDISSRTLFTEAAPWHSIVQRAGCCNRAGDDDTATLLWSFPPAGRNSAAPYEADDLARTAAALHELEGQAVTSTDLQRRAVKQATRLFPVLRRCDLLQLFDTTPDLTGFHIDVSPWIREGDDTDVFVLWRDFSENVGQPAADEPQPHHDELCPAPIDDVRKWAAEEGQRLWIRDRMDGAWRPVTPADVVPGAVLFADAAQGGYDPELGWAPASRIPVPPVPLAPGGSNRIVDSLGSDGPFFESAWVDLARHLTDVEEEVKKLITARSPSGLSAPQLAAASLAGRYHDLGKAHPAFQEMILKAGENPPNEILANAPGGRGLGISRRPYFSHALVSALMLLHPQSRLLDEAVERRELAEEDRDLVAYLVAAHHGKVRVSAPSMQDEALHEPPRLLGVEDGDHTLPVQLSPHERVDALQLDTSLFHVGAHEGESWTARVLRLCNRVDLGPFRLAYLEALVRIANMRVNRDYRAKEAR